MAKAQVAAEPEMGLQGKYHISPDSVEVVGEKTRLIVSFNDGAPEYYEVVGTDAESIYETLDKVALSVQSPRDAVAPTLETGKDLTVGHWKK